MIYKVAADFVKINETSGTIQNPSSCFTVEISNQPVIGSGIYLNPRDKMTFTNETLYARRTGSYRNIVELRVVPFYATEAGAGSGGSSGGSSSAEQFATDEELQELVNDVFNGDGGTDSGDVDPDIKELIDDVLGPQG